MPIVGLRSKSPHGLSSSKSARVKKLAGPVFSVFFHQVGGEFLNRIWDIDLTLSLNSISTNNNDTDDV